MGRLALVLIGVFVVGAAAQGDTLLLTEDFESYSNDEALFAVWRPTNGNSTLYWTPTDPAYLQAALVDSSFNSNAFPMGGKGVAHLGGVDSAANTAVLEWNGLDSNNRIRPSATQNIVIEGDIFDSGAFTGNRRISIALRSTVPLGNLLEMGFWNANTCDPTVTGCNPAGTIDPATTPGFYPATQYGARTQVFGSFSEPLITSPNWQYFQLPEELDRETDTDEIVSKGDIGEGWHRFKATFSETRVNLQIDLFRDGRRNTSTVPDEVTGERPGTLGVDAEMDWPLTMTGDGFNSLRIGAPSGLTSLESPAGNEVIFDNIKLALVDVATPSISADFNGNSTIDAADYVVWRKNSGLMGSGMQATGDANGDTNVDIADYDIWRATFGNNLLGSSNGVAAAVPEPSCVVLLIAGLAAFAIIRGKR